MRPLCACEIFWRGGCVSFLICRVWVCVFVRVHVHGKRNEGRFRRGFLQNSCRCPEMSWVSSPTKELELPLCLIWVIWLASFMQTLFSVTHTNIYTTVGTHMQAYSSWQALAAGPNSDLDISELYTQSTRNWGCPTFQTHTGQHTHTQVQKLGTVLMRLKCRATLETRWRKTVKEGGKIKAEKEENLKQ